MKAAVFELVDGAQVQIAEVDKLAHAREMEEPVAGDDPRDVPEERAEHDSAGEDALLPRRRPKTGRRRNAGISAATPITPSTPSASVIEPCTVKTSAHAAKTAASPHATVADADRCPNARATSQPGSSTTAVAAARRR